MTLQRRIWPGLPYPMGATWDGSGTNFALFSAHAEHVASNETVAYVLPQFENAGMHAVLIDTAKQQPQDTMTRRRVKSPYRTAPRSMVVIS